MLPIGGAASRCQVVECNRGARHEADCTQGRTDDLVGFVELRETGHEVAAVHASAPVEFGVIEATFTVPCIEMRLNLGCVLF